MSLHLWKTPCICWSYKKGERSGQQLARMRTLPRHHPFAVVYFSVECFDGCVHYVFALEHAFLEEI
jgi:hypothetical protein